MCGNALPIKVLLAVTLVGATPSLGVSQNTPSAISPLGTGSLVSLPSTISQLCRDGTLFGGICLTPGVGLGLTSIERFDGTAGVDLSVSPLALQAISELAYAAARRAGVDADDRLAGFDIPADSLAEFDNPAADARIEQIFTAVPPAALSGGAWRMFQISNTVTEAEMMAFLGRNGILPAHRTRVSTRLLRTLRSPATRFGLVGISVVAGAFAIFDFLREP